MKKIKIEADFSHNEPLDDLLTRLEDEQSFISLSQKHNIVSTLINHPGVGWNPDVSKNRPLIDSFQIPMFFRMLKIFRKLLRSGYCDAEQRAMIFSQLLSFLDILPVQELSDRHFECLLKLSNILEKFFDPTLDYLPFPKTEEIMEKFKHQTKNRMHWGAAKVILKYELRKQNLKLLCALPPSHQFIFYDQTLTSAAVRYVTSAACPALPLAKPVLRETYLSLFYSEHFFLKASLMSSPKLTSVEVAGHLISQVIVRFLENKMSHLAHDYGEWNVLADRLHVLSRKNYFSYPQLIVALKENPYLRDCRLISILLPWILSPTGKQYLAEDFNQKHQDQLILPFILDLQQNNTSIIGKISCCILVQFIKDILPREPQNVSPLINQLSKYVQKNSHIKKVWEEETSRGGKVDYSKVGEFNEKIVFISHQNPTSLLNSIRTFLTGEGHENDNTSIQNIYGVDPKLLPQLSLSSRLELASLLEDILISKPTRGVVTTYAALLETPGLKPSVFLDPVMLKRHQNNQSVLNYLLEIINFPLANYLRKFPKLCANLFVNSTALCDIKYQEAFSYPNLEHFFLNLLSYSQINDLLLALQEIPLSSFGLSFKLNRHMPFNLARIMKQRRCANPQMLNSLLKQLWEICPYKLSEGTLKFFPQELQAFYSDKESLKLNTKFKDELDKNRKNFLTLEKSAPALTDFYKKSENIPSRRSFFCVLWLIATHLPKFYKPESLKSVNIVTAGWTPQEKELAVYDLVDLVANSLNTDQDQLSTIQRCVPIISDWLWNHHICDFETFILAFLDRPELPNIFSFLQLLLSNDSQFFLRVKCFTDLCRENPSHPQSELLSRYFNTYPEPHGSEQFLNFSNVVLRMIPVMEVLLFRLIEHQLWGFLKEILDNYAPIYQWHPSPLELVNDILLYFPPDHIPPASRQSLLQITNHQPSELLQQPNQTLDVYLNGIFQHNQFWDQSQMSPEKATCIINIEASVLGDFQAYTPEFISHFLSQSNLNFLQVYRCAQTFAWLNVPISILNRSLIQTLSQDLFKSSIPFQSLLFEENSFFQNEEKHFMFPTPFHQVLAFSQLFLQFHQYPGQQTQHLRDIFEQLPPNLSLSQILFLCKVFGPCFVNFRESELAIIAPLLSKIDQALQEILRRAHLNPQEVTCTNVIRDFLNLFQTNLQ